MLAAHEMKACDKPPASTCHMGALTNACSDAQTPRHDEAHETLSPDRLERMFIYCTTWGLGGLLDVKDRAGFDAELRSFGANMPPRCALRGAASGLPSPPCAAVEGHVPRHAFLHVCSIISHLTSALTPLTPAGSPRATACLSGWWTSPRASGATGAPPCRSGRTLLLRSAPSLRSW